MQGRQAKKTPPPMPVNHKEVVKNSLQWWPAQPKLHEGWRLGWKQGRRGISLAWLLHPPSDLMQGHWCPGSYLITFWLRKRCSMEGRVMLSCQNNFRWGNKTKLCIPENKNGCLKTLQLCSTGDPGDHSEPTVQKSHFPLCWAPRKYIYIYIYWIETKGF